METGNVNNPQQRRDWGPLGGAYRNRREHSGGSLVQGPAGPAGKNDFVQDTRYRLTPLALRMPQRVEGLTLSKPPFMSRKSVETFLPAICRVFPSWVKV